MAAGVGVLPGSSWVGTVDGSEAERSTVKAVPKRRAARGEATESVHQRGLDFLERCHAGAPGVREEFVDAYGALVRFAMSSVLRQRGVRMEPEETEDLFQSLLLSFFDRDCRRLKLYDGRGGASFATFVRVCATRQTLDHLRHLRRQPTFVRDEGSTEGRSVFDDMPDPTADPEAAAATEERLRQLRERGAALPSREQLLVRLHFVEGRSIPEVARVLGITDNATHVLKSRLRAKLRERMELGDDE